MNIKKSIIPFAVAIILCVGCGKNTQMSLIGKEAAKKLALAEAGFTAKEARAVSSGLLTRNGVDYYRVDVTASDGNYQYDIDALTCTVIDARLPQGKTAEQDAQADKVSEKQTGKNSQAQTDQTNNTAFEAQANTTSQPGTEMLTADKAKAKALAHAGISTDAVVFLKTKLDEKDGRMAYDVEFYAQGDGEFDYEIDAFTGEIISFDHDVEKYPQQAFNNSEKLTEQKARELAFSQVPGATQANLYEFKTDIDDGRILYEGKIIYSGMEYDFEIDAYSGAICSWDSEPLD